MESSNIYIGKVREYDSFIGEIVTQDETYLFMSDDIEDDTLLSKDDVVMFRGETIHDKKRAFFIKKLNPEYNLEDQVQRRLRKTKENE